MKILIPGGAGFVGSHLVDRLMLMGHQVVVLDSMITGSPANVAHWIGHPNFALIKDDVIGMTYRDRDVDRIYNLACVASPPLYKLDPVHTLDTCYLGTSNVMRLSEQCLGSHVLIASTSEVYGDPKESPQNEEYW